MIVHFPTLEALRLALTAAVVPSSVALAPARAAFPDDGECWVQTDVTLPRAAQAELAQLGARIVRSAGVELDQEVTCWPQLLPLRADVASAAPSERTPVLFELPQEQLVEVINEILRLGNDRQSFRWFDAGGTGRALLRVIGPPYYSLLRALDQHGDQTPRAYLEQAPRVWCQIGTQHPLAEQLQPPAGELLLLRPPRQWMVLAEGKFRDIYDAIEFRLPDVSVAWQPGELPSRLIVPLRLARGSASEAAELWVLRENGLEQLDALVHEADNHLLARLAFANAQHKDHSVLVLRVRPSRQTPPILVLQGVGFRPYLKLPNLFVPCDSRLHPPLRRDAVARLLAPEPDQLTWLYPNPDGTFTPEYLPDTAFRPLEQWVDFVLEHDRQALQIAIHAAQFDFEPFVCTEDQPVSPRKGQGRDRSQPKKSEQDDQLHTLDESASPAQLKIVNKSRKKPTDDGADEPIIHGQSNELQQALHTLEKQFLELPLPLDAVERQDLWRRMAQLNAALKQYGDASLCWLAGQWEQENPTNEWLRGWLATETRAAEVAEEATATIEQLVAAEVPSATSLRRLTALLVCTAHHTESPAEVLSQLDRLAHLLEQHEGQLPTRAVWLAWVALVALSQGDILALARARDRLLDRLFQRGLSPELDLPTFLRFSGIQGSERVRGVRDQLTALFTRIKQWAGPAPTSHYLDLLFAYGMARLGDGDQARKLLQAAQEGLFESDMVHTWLCRAFEHRIRQVLDGKPAVGTLPADLLHELDILKSESGDKETDRRNKDLLYKIDRLRQFSRILEPHEKIDAYRTWHGQYTDELSRELAQLSDIRDRGQLTDRLRRLMNANLKKEQHLPSAQARIMRTAFELAPRLGEAFAREVLARVDPLLAQPLEVRDRSLLVEKALFLAAHFDQGDQVRSLVTVLHQILGLVGGPDTLGTLDTLLGETFRGLRKLGMRTETDVLLQALATMVLRGKTVNDLSAQQGLFLKQGNTIEGWVAVLKALLQVATGWYYFGQDDRARPVLDEIRKVLFEGDLISVRQTELACAYVAALGHAPLDFAAGRLHELFRKVERIQDTFTTNSHYALSKLKLIEAVILTLVSEDAALDTAGRRWLDDDEYLIRRRIHRDVRMALGRAGL